MNDLNNINSIYKILDSLNILYKKVNHPAVFTTEDADLYPLEEGTGLCKNLFLRNIKTPYIIWDYLNNY